MKKFYQSGLTFCFALLFSMILTIGQAYADCANPAGTEGQQIYNTTHKTMQFCDGTNWIAMKGGVGSGGGSSGSGSGPSGCVLEGQFCDDGTILAGVAGNEVFYVTDVNQGTSIQWATVSQNNSGARSDTDGQANQGWIVANRTLSQYPAFELCENLNRHGHTDWYLPSKDELNAMYGNKDTIGDFTTSIYWSSTEVNSTSAWRQDFSNGVQHNNQSKIYNPSDVRCVRKN